MYSKSGTGQVRTQPLDLRDRLSYSVCQVLSGLLALTLTCCVTRKKLLSSPNLTFLTDQMGAVVPSSKAVLRIY